MTRASHADRGAALFETIVGIVVVAIVAAILYGFGVFVNSVSQKHIDDRCSNIAWRAAKASGTDAGRAAEIACRSEAGQDK
jgi:hypothetical protein